MSQYEHGGWFLTADLLPEQGQEVVALWDEPNKGRMAEVCSYFSGEFLNDDGNALQPTHWMILPPNANVTGLAPEGAK